MEHVGRSALPAALRGTSTCCGAGVACGLCVAQRFPTDRAGGSTQDQGDISNHVLLLDQAGQRHAVFRLELLISSVRGALHLRTLLGGRCCTSGWNPPPHSGIHCLFRSAATEIESTAQRAMGGVTMSSGWLRNSRGLQSAPKMFRCLRRTDVTKNPPYLCSRKIIVSFMPSYKTRNAFGLAASIFRRPKKSRFLILSKPEYFRKLLRATASETRSFCSWNFLDAYK